MLGDHIWPCTVAMVGNRALLLYLLGTIDRSLHACLYALELMFVCCCYREVFRLGTNSEESLESQVEPCIKLGAGLHSIYC